MKRSARLTTAKDTVRITERGTYSSASGRLVDVSDAVRRCLDSTRHFSPQEVDRCRADVLTQINPNFVTSIDVANETTLEGIFRLLAERPSSVAALNFASARNPGQSSLVLIQGAIRD